MTPRERLAAAVAKTRDVADDNCSELKELREAWAAFEVSEAERHKRLASAVDDAACDLGCAHREESADALRGAWREFDEGTALRESDAVTGPSDVVKVTRAVFKEPAAVAIPGGFAVKLTHGGSVEIRYANPGTEDLKSALLALSGDEFLTLIHCRCKHCGSPGEGRCYCQRDPGRD